MTATSSRTRAWFPIVIVLGATLLPWLLAEGIHIVAKGAKAQTSMAYSFLSRLGSEAPAPVADPHDPTSQMIVRVGDIEELLPAMKASGMGLGNSPFSELKTEEASVNSEKGPCLEQKPNLRKKVGYLRTNLFNPFDQMSFFVDADRELPAELDAFLERYAFRVVSHSTNEFGERVTLPAVDASRVVLVAGDSVANGLAIDDSETLSSQLQARDSSRRYVNLGIARARAADITCAIDRAASRYRGVIDEVIYVLCENDFEQGGKYSEPEELTAWLEEFQKREGVARVTLIVQPLIYNTVPEVTRLRGHSHYDWPTFRDERSSVIAFALAKGFGVVDFVDITAAERVRGRSQFAPLALYVDHAHWSPAGVARVADALVKSGTGTDFPKSVPVPDFEGATTP
ncbi:MAG: SGNH/GDSL hydrolase family protein [Candidatus Binatia bacterium]